MSTMMQSLWKSSSSSRLSDAAAVTPRASEPSSSSSSPPMTFSTTASLNEESDSNSGRLVATILSVHDLTDEEPTSVCLRLEGVEVGTGPPTARHKEKNSYKFVNTSKEGSSSAQRNELTISAPLSTLYPAVATFAVTFGSGSAEMVAQCQLNTTLLVNGTQWLILNLQQSDDLSSTLETPPTLRLKLRLEGPYRPEVAALEAMGLSWFRAVDSLTDTLSSALPHWKMPSWKVLLVPGVPLVATGVVLSPVLLGVLILGLPFFLPLLAIVAAFVGTLGVGVLTLYFSTVEGRSRLLLVVDPIYSTFVSTAIGQRLVYDTGPRPSPVALSKAILPDDLVGKLLVSLLIDFVGSSSYLLPGVGEALDVSWAPIQTILIMALYDQVTPSLKYVSFVEEILPFTDVVPSATLGWLREFGPLVLGGLLGKGESNVGSELPASAQETLALVLEAAKTNTDTATTTSGAVVQPVS